MNPTPHRPSRTEIIELRGLACNVRHWGEAGAPMLFMLHGRMDSSATFQFVVDALAQSWHVVAPDWRGYGASAWLSQPYWYHDYYADLDALLAHYAPDEPARLVGHSMGANIASLYAAARSERVAQLAMLDFLGLPRPAGDAAAELRKWLDALAERPQLRVYPDEAALARQMMGANPRLTPERAAFLARETGRRTADGIARACDPWHKLGAPMLYRVDEAMDAWRRIAAPVLLLIADRGYVQQRFGEDAAELERRLACFADRRVARVEDCGHNMQHDRPEAVAAALEAFFQSETPA